MSSLIRSLLRPLFGRSPRVPISILAARTRMTNFGFPVAFHTSAGTDHTLASVCVTLTVPDRASGFPLPVCSIGYLLRSTMTEKRWPSYIRKEIIRAVIHEIDEALHFDGHRVFDPHRHEKDSP